MDDLLSRLEKGSVLVADDAKRLFLGERVCETHLAAAAQKAVEEILAQNSLFNLGVITGKSVKKILATVSPANA